MFDVLPVAARRPSRPAARDWSRPWYRTMAYRHKVARPVRRSRVGAITSAQRVTQIQGDDHTLILMLPQVGVNSLGRDQVGERAPAESWRRFPEPQQVTVCGEHLLFCGWSGLRRRRRRRWSPAKPPGKSRRSSMCPGRPISSPQVIWGTPRVVSRKATAIARRRVVTPDTAASRG